MPTEISSSGTLFINLKVLEDVGLVPDQVEPARLPGFDIVVRPLADFVPSAEHEVFGISIQATHVELTCLYNHAKDVLGDVYLPQAVLTHTPKKEKATPALCYIAHHKKPAPALNEYLDRIVDPAREYGFPRTYCERLESFRPQADREVTGDPPV